MALIYRLTLVFFLISNSLMASFKEDIKNIADEIAQKLELSPEKPIYITTIQEDRSYMLPMEPVFKELKKELSTYVSEVRFRSPQGSEIGTLIDIMRNGMPMRIEEMAVDSLILTGSYFLMNQSLDKINCILKIQDIRAVNLYECDEFTISEKDCPPAFKRKIFSKLVDNETYGEIEYKGYVIDKLEKIFNAGNNNLLLSPAVYAFVNKHPYAINYQINALKEILNLKYGISFNQESENKIIVHADGTLIFVRDGKGRPLQKIVDGEPLYGSDFSSQNNTYKYSTDSTTANGIKKKKWEDRKFSTEGEIKVRDRIFETFNEYYPALFTPFNYNKLNEIFAVKKEPSILVGIVKSSDPSTGKEIVAYSWQKSQQWLDHLKKLHDVDNRTFEITTSVMKIFNDDLDPNRYWAIIRQNWKTIDGFGKTVYSDDGFLFVNFDFTADQVLKDFKIYYRLWFYEYQYDDLELGIKRYAKLENDITTHFKNGIKSVSGSLKSEMCDYLISQIKKSGTGLKVR
ncbi:MAG: hypothetical protein GX640_00435 [Fibrobacter sp.]|nr:hypothetical protein [Fibrobacter sp.]